MQWQDIVLTLGNFFFVIALIPSIKLPDKPAILTSLMNAVVLFIFVLTELTLRLWLTATVTLVVALMWSVLAWQKYQQNRSVRQTKH